MMMIGLLNNEAQQDAKVAQTTLTYILTVHRNQEIPVPDVSGFRSQTRTGGVLGAVPSAAV